MGITRLSTKGQVIVPKMIREAHQWKPGTELLIEEVPEGVLLRALQSFPPARLEEVAGCLGYSGTAKGVNEMKRTIAKEARRRRGRGRY